VKPAPFDYVRPATVADAADHLHDADGEAKILAGGQSLIPLLNFRLASPRVLVDINGIGDLAYSRPSDTLLAVGSMTRLRALERDEWVPAAASPTRIRRPSCRPLRFYSTVR
jgi:CO/xanthine dehydrogenase FAD-binding subunit